MEELNAGPGIPDTTSVFHGDSMKDYKGRSYILPPESL